jgi:hypothetical protein
VITECEGQRHAAASPIGLSFGNILQGRLSMAETTCWTKDDMPRALEWVRREAKAGLEFRAERVNLVEALQELGAITEPQNLAQALRLELTEDAWLRLSDTLRPHERKAPLPRGVPALVVARRVPSRAA